MWLSPSSIIYFNSCPLKFYFRYILKLKEIPTVHLIKGSAIHKTLEKLFENKKYLKDDYCVDLKKTINLLLDNELTNLNSLNLTIFEKEEHINDSKQIITNFTNKLIEKIECLLLSHKAENPTHAFHLLKPKFKELSLQDNELKVRGIIDRIQIGFDDKITIVDYKTSNKFGNELSSDYELQLAIYAYLYYKNNKGRIPDKLCVNYLRFGESFYLNGNLDLINYAIYNIKNVRNFIVNNNDKQECYFRKQSPLCSYCSFKEKCLKEEKNEDKQPRLSI